MGLSNEYDYTFARCYIGKRHLEAAMKDFESTFDFDIEWKPFLLNPNTPDEGVPVLEYLAQRYGQKVADDARTGKSDLIKAAVRAVSLSLFYIALLTLKETAMKKAISL